MVDDNDILGNVGALGVGEENNGVAMSALHHLIESGKVSVDDAKAAVHAVQEMPNHYQPIIRAVKRSYPNNLSLKRRINQIHRKKNIVHVMWHCNSLPSDYTGFAQNVGKENDNSIEKALFAALEKTRLLVHPDEHGMLVMNEDEEKNIVVKGGDNSNNDMNGENEWGERYWKYGLK